MGLPHFTNSKVATGNMEPVYLNLFEVGIVPPQGFPINDLTLMLENVKKVGGLEVDKMPALVEQVYRGAKRRFVGALPDSTTLDINIEWEVNLSDTNQMFVYEILRAWADLCWDPLTGTRHLKTDYASGAQLSIAVHNKKGDIFRNIVAYNCFPMSALPPMELDYSSGTNIYTVNLTFAVDYWDDNRTG